VTRTLTNNEQKLNSTNITNVPHKHTQVTTSLNWHQSPSSNEVGHLTCSRPTHHLLKMSLLQLILKRLYFILQRSNNRPQHLCVFLRLADVHTHTYTHPLANHDDMSWWHAVATVTWHGHCINSLHLQPFFSSQKCDWLYEILPISWSRLNVIVQNRNTWQSSDWQIFLFCTITFKHDQLIYSPTALYLYH